MDQLMMLLPSANNIFVFMLACLKSLGLPAHKSEAASTVIRSAQCPHLVVHSRIY